MWRTTTLANRDATNAAEAPNRTIIGADQGPDDARSTTYWNTALVCQFDDEDDGRVTNDTVSTEIDDGWTDDARTDVGWLSAAVRPALNRR